AGAIADEAHRLAHGAVTLAVEQNLVARLEFERAQHDVGGSGSVLDENQVGRVGMQKARKLRDCRTQCLWQHVAEKTVGIGLHLGPPALGGRQHAEGWRPERAMIDEVNPGLEQELASKAPPEAAHRTSVAVRRRQTSRARRSNRARS